MFIHRDLAEQVAREPRRGGKFFGAQPRSTTRRGRFRLPRVVAVACTAGLCASMTLFGAGNGACAGSRHRIRRPRS